jgi:hypothetical protein
MSIFSTIGNLFSRIAAIFRTDKAHAVLHTILELAAKAEAIVVQIDQLAPHKTLDQITAAYEHFGVPLLTPLADGNLTVARNAMMNLGVEALKKIAPTGTALDILVSAVNMAVSAAKANK